MSFKINSNLSKNNIINLLVPVILFMLSYYFLPLNQVFNNDLIPSNDNDSLLNNYFLENIYLYLTQKSTSLWHLSFYYPFPYVLGFSDNLFGSSPIYIIARYFYGDASSAYKIWFLVAYLFNYISCFYVLKKLGLKTLGSTAGALFFAFGLPTTAQLNHLQLHYRFALVLSVFYYLNFLNNKNIKYLIICIFWLIWQFYCGIYMGFFTMCMLLSITIGFLIINLFNKNYNIFPIKSMYFNILSSNKIYFLFYSIGLSLILMVILFYPYLKVNQLYKFKREWSEISSMLPNLTSYLISDRSYFWCNFSRHIDKNIPMRWEHNLFIGLVPLILFMHGLYVSFKSKIKNQTSTLLFFCIVFIFLSILKIGDVSFWFYLYKLPLFSAIRAITRFDQALMFPIAYFMAISIDNLQFKKYTKIIILFIFSLLIIEYCNISISNYSKKEWNSYLENRMNSIKSELKLDSILFFAQTDPMRIKETISAMWLSQRLGLPTLNGYSGSLPPAYDAEYDTDCTEMPKRIYSYLNFIGKKNNEIEFLALINRVVPIGFTNCNPNWLKHAPGSTYSNRPYTKEEISKIKYEFIDKVKVADHWVVNVRIINLSNTVLSAGSSLDQPLRISWGFIDSSKNILNPWNTRKSLPFDIGPNESLILQIPIHKGMEIKGGVLQISMVQELVFWAHDIGVEPLSIQWSDQ